MPRLIHLNGPPGIGKSTLAQLYVDGHPGVLNLDIDQLRSLIGGSQDRFEETGEIVRQLAVGMARTHLSAGRDVVLPQYLGRLTEVERFESVALDSGATFCEVMLMDTKEQSVARFTRRGERDALPWHRHVVEAVEAQGGSTRLAELHDRLTEIVRARPHVVVVPSVEGAVQATYDALCRTLSGAPPDAGVICARLRLTDMITAVHSLIYSDDPEATRAFLRDVLGWPYVEHPESEPGWLIFKTGPSEMGVHPTKGSHEGSQYAYPLHHSISLMCDDVEATVAELEGKGATFSGGIEDYGFGLATMLRLPGAGEIMLYQPQHPEAHSL